MRFSTHRESTTLVRLATPRRHSQSVALCPDIVAPSTRRPPVQSDSDTTIAGPGTWTSDIGKARRVRTGKEYPAATVPGHLGSTADPFLPNPAPIPFQYLCLFEEAITARRLDMALPCFFGPANCPSSFSRGHARKHITFPPRTGHGPATSSATLLIVSPAPGPPPLLDPKEPAVDQCSVLMA